jgi:hypothetical protein
MIGSSCALTALGSSLPMLSIEQPNHHMIITPSHYYITLTKSTSSMAEPAKWIQMTHLEIAINTMNDTVVVFRASLNYLSANATTLELGGQGRYGAQLAFEGQLLAQNSYDLVANWSVCSM